MDPADRAVLARRWLDLGLAPDKIAAIEHTLNGDDGRQLLHELLLCGLWDNVIDESGPQPQWIDRWRTLSAEGFPLINGEALDRLMQAGADPHDLTDVVRSAQILAIYNIAQLLDYPTQALGWDIPESATAHLSCTVGETGEDAARRHHRLHALHPELLARDPSGRHGEPRSLEWRQLRALPIDVQEQIEQLFHARKMSQAAALWKKHVGGDSRECLDAVQRLAGQWGASDDETV